MLEIISLVYLSRKIGVLAEEKGLKRGKWKLIFVIGWFILEFIGFIIALPIFGKDNLVSVILLAYTFAITSYFILKTYLSKLPDAVIDDDINDIGKN